MKITAVEEYGLRLMLQLARAGETGRSLAELSQREGIPLPFAAKVLSRLRQHGLVSARRGRSGGYTLKKPPETIRLDQILAALGEPLFHAEFCADHAGAVEACCVHTADCSVRPLFFHLDRMFRQFFASTTLADLLSSERAVHQQLSRRYAQRLPSFSPSAWGEGV